jgi:hypothetical protein
MEVFILYIFVLAQRLMAVIASLLQKETCFVHMKAHKQGNVGHALDGAVER